MVPATALLGLTALGDLVIAARRRRGAQRAPAWIAMVHGLAAAPGLALLVNAVLAAEIAPATQVVLALLVLAALEKS